MLAGETLTSLRTARVIGRAVSDSLSAETGQVRQPSEVIFGIADHLGCSPTDIAARNTFADLALKHPSHVPFVDVSYDGKSHDELVALPIGLGRAKQIVGLATESNPVADAVSLPGSSAELSQEALKVADAEYIFFERNPAIYEPIFEWHSAIEESHLLGNDLLLTRIEAEIHSRRFDPNPGLRLGQDKRSIGRLIDESRKSQAEKTSLTADLNYPQHGFRIFHATHMRYFQVSLEVTARYDAWQPDDDWAGTMLAHEFGCWLRIPFHHFVIAPAHAPFVYVRGAAIWNTPSTLNVFKDLSFQEYAGDDGPSPYELKSKFSVRSHRIEGIEDLNPALADHDNYEEIKDEIEK